MNIDCGSSRAYTSAGRDGVILLAWVVMNDGAQEGRKTDEKKEWVNLS